ncbi:alpha/beta hydrolase family protein [Metallococcus carri]|nr:alpha/beta family hydrolase [Metallococcus carri]
MARAHVERPRGAAVGSLVLGHGAGGGIESPDLEALRAVVDEGWCYVRVEMPWRVAGRRIAPAPKTLDAGWVPILHALTTGRGRLPGPLVVGGRSAGARVACRTAADLGARAVLALSFPLHPSGRPDKSRAEEVLGAAAAGIPVSVVQGARDPFGRPEELRAALPGIPVYAVPGDHSFSRAADGVLAAVSQILAATPRE